MNRLTQGMQLLQNMGTRYVMYRVKHEFEKKSGRLKKRHPANLQLKKTISLGDWKESKKPFLIPSKEQLAIPQIKSDILLDKVQRILRGELQYFNAEWLNIGKEYNWITNPSNGYQYDISKHWSEIPDLSETAGDIKYVWEKSRFSYLLTLIRYDYHFDDDMSEFVFSEIDSWIDANPINYGPNWRCSQEISLRIFNWCYALYYYQNSKALTEARWLKIQNIIYASLHHVYHHIDFSRIAVRNNHAITETLFLTLSEILFPFIPETKLWAKKGKMWFEEEIDYQIYDDGTFLQFSMNYHRVVIQLLSFGISIYELNDSYFKKHVYEKSYKSLNFLYQCLEESNGNLPNYGANDGALFFPLTDGDYRDYRPQLNTMHFLLTNNNLWEQNFVLEDSWWHGKTQLKNTNLPLNKIFGNLTFDQSGYFLHREMDNFTFIRCGGYKNRPNQADNLHIDIWYKGQNVFRDQGSYKYNTTNELLNYFKGTEAHNTVTVTKENQMKRGGRFLWYYWVKNAKGSFKNSDDLYFKGHIDAFNHLNKNITHTRIVQKEKGKTVWVVKDILNNTDGLEKDLHWHFDQKFYDHINVEATDKNGEKISYTLEDVWYSSKYGVKEPSKMLKFNTLSTEITTIIKIDS